MNKALIFKTSSLLILLSLLGAGCGTNSGNQNPNTATLPEQTTAESTTNNAEPLVATSTATSPTASPTAPAPAPTPASTRATYYGVSGVDKVGSVTTGYLATSKVYKDSGFYYQFVNCHGSPGLLRMKVGTKFMLDNRDKVTHKIVLGDTTYSLPGYGYIIATAPRILGTQHLVCDGGGAALLNVEK